MDDRHERNARSRVTPFTRTRGATIARLTSVVVCALLLLGAHAWEGLPRPVIDRRAPTNLAFAAVSVGAYHTCGVTAVGDAYCWGDNRYGQLGDGTGIDRTSPVPVVRGLSFAAVSAMGSHSCGVTTVGDAYCWGYNNYGQLGDGTLINRSFPVPVGWPIPNQRATTPERTIERSN